MKINERVRFLRKEILGKTQQVFAEEIKISRSNLGNIETGEVSVTDRVISSICDKFNVNEEWIRTGRGEPMPNRTRAQEIGDFASKVMNMPDETIQNRLLAALTKMNERDWEALEKLVDNLRGD